MTELVLDDSRAGVLPGQWIAKAIDSQVITSAFSIAKESSIQPASLDLRLGEVAYRLRCSFLPNGQTVEARLVDLAMDEFKFFDDGAILERNRPYLIPLAEEIHLPSFLRAKANPKSSTGRLDIFTRVICDRGYQFDEIPSGYDGRLYLEVVSRSFTIKVRRGLSLNQLRLMLGDTRVSADELRAAHDVSPLLYVGDRPVSPDRLVTRDGGLFLTLDLLGEPGLEVGYRAKKNSQLVDLSNKDLYDPTAFWEPAGAEPLGRLVLEPDEFYLLISHEAVSIPPQFAAEMTPYDPTSGELRTHYAGFFDPGFGYDPDGVVRGTRAALEVRAHDVPFMVERGQQVCKLSFEWMYESPTSLYGDAIGSHYQSQQVALSKHFKFPKPSHDGQLRLLDGA